MPDRKFITLMKERLDVFFVMRYDEYRYITLRKTQTQSNRVTYEGVVLEFLCFKE